MDMGASVIARLKNKAKETGKPFQLHLQLFCQEEFLRRLAASRYAENLVLKGGLFIYTLTNFESRATVDIDFLLQQFPGRIEDIKRMVDEIIDRFFSAGEVQEIWLTFSDPQMKNVRKRLTSTYFMERYRRFLVDGGIVHVKTDSNFLFTYTTYMVEHNHLPLLFHTEDLYHTAEIDDDTRRILSIQTYYESQWIERGLNIRYMKFRLPHEGALEESEIEIPVDDYRSYKRTGRSGVDKRK